MKYKEDIETDLLDSKEIITLKSFSNKFGLGLEESNDILQNFIKKTKLPVRAYYLITGLTNSGNLVSTLSASLHKQSVCDELKSINQTLYAILPDNGDPLISLYYKNKETVLPCMKEEVFPVLFTANRVSEIEPESRDPKLETNNDQSNTHDPSSPSNSVIKDKETLSKVSAPPSNTTTHKPDTIKTKPTKSNSLLNLFANHSVKDKKVNSSSDDSHNVEAESDLQSSKTGRYKCPAKKSGTKRKSNTQSNKKADPKRKRIIAVSDSSTSEDEDLDCDDILPVGSPVVDNDVDMPPINGMNNGSSSNVITEAENLKSPGKAHERVLVPKSFLTEDGFMETKWEYETKDIEDKSVTLENRNETTQIKPEVDYVKASPAAKEKKLKESSRQKVTKNTSKQASITNFFTKR